jgi:hypothetical protein
VASDFIQIWSKRTLLLRGIGSVLCLLLSGCTAEQQAEFAAGWAQGQANGARFREGLARFATGYSETYNSPDAELHRMHQEQQMVLSFSKLLSVVRR